MCRNNFALSMHVFIIDSRHFEKLIFARNQITDIESHSNNIYNGIINHVNYKSNRTRLIM